MALFRRSKKARYLRLHNARGIDAWITVDATGKVTAHATDPKLRTLLEEHVIARVLTQGVPVIKAEELDSGNTVLHTISRTARPEDADFLEALKGWQLPFASPALEPYGIELVLSPIEDVLRK